MLNYDHINIPTNRFNKMSNNQCFLERGKYVKALAFSKANKESIISLYFNVFHKTFGKPIKQSICEFITKHKLLPDDSYGFRGRVDVMNMQLD